MCSQVFLSEKEEGRRPVVREGDVAVGVVRSQGIPVVSGIWKRQGMDSPQEPPEGARAADTLILAPRDSLWTSDLRNYKRVGQCCFEPVSVWSFAAAAPGD